MFWRASISSHFIYDDYQLDPTIEETLRTALLSNKAETRGDVIAKIATSNLPFFPYVALTSRNFQDGTANSIAAINPGMPASLHVDQFGLILFSDEASFPNDVFKQIANIQPNDHRFAILSQESWHKLMVERLALEYAKSNKKKTF